MLWIQRWLNKVAFNVQILSFTLKSDLTWVVPIAEIKIVSFKHAFGGKQAEVLRKCLKPVFKNDISMALCTDYKFTDKIVYIKELAFQPSL